MSTATGSIDGKHDSEEDVFQQQSNCSKFEDDLDMPTNPFSQQKANIILQVTLATLVKYAFQSYIPQSIYNTWQEKDISPTKDTSNTKTTT